MKFLRLSELTSSTLEDRDVLHALRFSKSIWSGQTRLTASYNLLRLKTRGDKLFLWSFQWSDIPDHSSGLENKVVLQSLSLSEPTSRTLEDRDVLQFFTLFDPNWKELQKTGYVSILRISEPHDHRLNARLQDPLMRGKPRNDINCVTVAFHDQVSPVSLQDW